MTTAEFIEATEHIEGAEGDFDGSPENRQVFQEEEGSEESTAVLQAPWHEQDTDTKDCKVLKAHDSQVQENPPVQEQDLVA
jgi:hypothetical protein